MIIISFFFSSIIRGLWQLQGNLHIPSNLPHLFLLLDHDSAHLMIIHRSISKAKKSPQRSSMYQNGTPVQLLRAENQPQSWFF